MNKKRVLLVSPSSLNNGGVQFVFMTIVRQLSDKYDFDIVVFDDYQNFYKEEFLSYGGEIFNINIYHLGFFKRAFCKIFKNLILHAGCNKVLKKKHYDIIHCFNQFDSGLFLKKAYKSGIKTRICRSGGCYTKESYLKESIRDYRRKQIKKYATVLTGVSEDSCKTFYGENSSYKVINNPSNDSIVYSDKNPEILTLLQIAMFNRNKNHEFTLEVYSELLKLIDTKLIFIGTENHDYLNKKISLLNLNGKIEFLPVDFDKNIVFEKSSYLIFPSISESFGNVLIEAQKAGITCFASDTIPTHANCGGVHFLPLEKGPKFWADYIYNDFLKTHGKKQKYDCSAFTIPSFIENIEKLYNNN